MRYVDRMLGVNETVLGFTRPTWWSGFWVYVLAAIFLLPTSGLSLIFIIPVVINTLTTEIALTNKRVIIKKGLLRRDADELRISKIEFVKVNQSITGRILGYSTISIVGTGGTKLVARGCAKGNQFRQKIFDQIEG